MGKYLIRTFLLSLVLVCFGQLKAQLTFIFNAQAMGKDMRGLSSVQVINSTRESYIGNIDIEIKSLDPGVTIIKIFIPSVSILPGNNLIPYTKFATASVYYAATLEGNYVKQTGMMPEGELEYCFKYTITSKILPNEVYENCFLGTNIIATPLELILPENGDSFCEKRPRFSWQPPMPLAPAISFTLKLVQLVPGQSQSEALLVNPAIIFQTNIKGWVFSYPAAAPDLKEGNVYAWQVTANIKGKQLLSEIWEFTIRCEKPETTDKSYRELKSEDDGGFLSTGTNLRFAVFNPYTPGSLKYSISDLAQPNKKFKGLPVFVLQKGANNILLDLKKVPGMEDGNEYLLSVILPDGRKVSLRFKYDEADE